MGTYDEPLKLTRNTVAESDLATDIFEGEDASPTL